MKYGDFTLTQVKEVGRVIGGARAVKKLLAGKLVVVPAEGWKPSREKKLGPACAHRILPKTSHDPNAFFRSRGGMFVGHDFRARIVVAASPVRHNGPPVQMSCASLVDLWTSGRELLTLCPSGVFHATEFCTLLAVALESQSGGQNGHLSTERPNLFLVEGVCNRVYIVRASWRVEARKGQGEWVVNAETLEKVFGANCKFFSRR